MPGCAHLYKEVKVALVIVAACGGIATRNVLPFDLGSDRDMLANGQTEHIFGMGQPKAITITHYKFQLSLTG